MKTNVYLFYFFKLSFPLVNKKKQTVHQNLKIILILYTFCVNFCNAICDKKNNYRNNQKYHFSLRNTIQYTYTFNTITIAKTGKFYTGVAGDLFRFLLSRAASLCRQSDVHIK